MEWMDWLSFVVMGCNLIFAIFVFSFLARPVRLMDKVVQVSKDKEKLSNTSLDAKEQNLTIKGFSSISLLLLILLFLTSCITGGVIVYIRLYQQSQHILNP
ncbi:MAG: hypothetical protein CMK59_06330 [Proteobacteria bacterium]|nr:hypothetical protein [Pseudomonadota bacterium]